MNSVARKRGNGKIKVMQRREALREALGMFSLEDIDVKVSLIQSLIPLGLEHVKEELQKEVFKLAGEARKHGKVNTRWGRQGGSIYLSDQKVPLDVPRVRNKLTKKEVSLETYHKFQSPYTCERQLFLKLLYGLSTHNYKEATELAPEVFGISASSVSRRFRRWSAKYLQELMSRRLEEYDLVALFIDGKVYARQGLVIILGITMEGRKIVLGIEQMNTENSRCVGQCLEKLINRGLRYEEGLLVIVDGSKGIITAVRKKLAGYALIQRCQQHKKENIVSYLPKEEQKVWRMRLSQAYNLESFQEARRELEKLCRQLEILNPSAAQSMREGMSETLTLHRLGLKKQLGLSFSSTNCIESVLSQLGRYTNKVSRWRNGRHIQEWAAAGLLQIEPKLRKVKGWRYLPFLRERLRAELKLEQKEQAVTKEEFVGVRV